MTQRCRICGVCRGGLVAFPPVPLEPWPEPDLCQNCNSEAATAIAKRANRTKSRASWLDDACCVVLRDAFGHPPYLVGSCMTRPDYRDVDVSTMLPDAQFGAMFPNKYALLFMNAAVSEWLSSRTGLRIDFKFQDTTKANEEHQGPRNPLGIRGELFSRERPTT